VIVKTLAQRQTVDINHFVAKMAFQCGNVRDPVTGRRCRGSQYIDESRRTFNKLDLADKLQSVSETKISAK
jgi:small subunit ribosomal protein S17